MDFFKCPRRGKNIIRPKLSLKVGYISCIEIYAFIEAVIWWGIILIFLGS